MLNSGVVIVVSCLLAFCALAATTVAWTAPSVEASLVTTAEVALEKRNLSFAKVGADGRDLVVTGEAPSLLKREEALRVVATTWGHRVIFDRMTVTAPRPPAPPPPPPAAPQVPPETLALIACQETVNALLGKEQFTFEFGRARLSPDSAGLLDRLAALLNECPNARFEIEGHTDSQGSDNVNRRISKDRAEAVLRALAIRGISERRMLAIGYGSSRPIAPNNDPDGRARNRRIEMRVLRKD